MVRLVLFKFDIEKYIYTRVQNIKFRLKNGHILRVVNPLTRTSVYYGNLFRRIVILFSQKKEVLANLCKSGSKRIGPKPPRGEPQKRKSGSVLLDTTDFAGEGKENEDGLRHSLGFARGIVM